jgi:hypothetical protein
MEEEKEDKTQLWYENRKKVRNEYMKEWRRKNKDRINQKTREVRAANRDEWNKKQLERYYNNKNKEKNKSYYQINKEQIQQIKQKLKRTQKNNHLLRFYNITIEQYEQMLYEQDNKCYICEELAEDTRKKSLNVDHDHITGKVRKLLCGNCNTSLGLAKENEVILQKMINYLNEHKDIEMKPIGDA